MRGQGRQPSGSKQPGTLHCVACLPMCVRECTGRAFTQASRSPALPCPALPWQVPDELFANVWKALQLPALVSDAVAECEVWPPAVPV